MKYVYIEEIVALNLISNLIIIYSVIKMRRINLHIARVIVGALVGALFAVLVAMYDDINNVGYKIIVTLIMSLLISERMKAREVIVSFSLLTICSFTASGIVIFISMISSGVNGVMTEYIFRTNYIIILFSLLSARYLTSYLYRFALKRFNLQGDIYLCDITAKDKTVSLKLLNDSGNLLRSIGGEPICVISKKMFYRITQIKSEFDTYTDYSVYYDNLSDEDKQRVSVVKIGTVIGSKLQLYYRADSLSINNSKTLRNVLISSGSINSTSYDGVINMKEYDNR